MIFPAHGYVMVVATAQLSIYHNSGTADGVFFGVSLDQTPSLTDMYSVSITEHWPSGYRHEPVTVSRVFEVEKGLDYIYLVAYKHHGGSMYATRYDLNVAYFPTNYEFNLISSSGDDGNSEQTMLEERINSIVEQRVSEETKSLIEEFETRLEKLENNPISNK